MPIKSAGFNQVAPSTIVSIHPSDMLNAKQMEMVLVALGYARDNVASININRKTDGDCEYTTDELSDAVYKLMNQYNAMQ